MRLATSWAGLFSAYAIALILAVAKFKEISAALSQTGLPPLGGIALIAAFPLLALVFSTIPSRIERQRIKHYGQIKVDLRAGYFTLRPRDTEEGFERVDNAHHEVLRWIEEAKRPVLYLTGASGTGKSSLLAAWVIPKLRRENHVVIQLRGYEQLFERIKDRLFQPGLIWSQPFVREIDLRSLLDRACRRLGERRLIIVVDQFEEFLILKDEEQRNNFQQCLSAKPIDGLTFLLVYRPEYEGLIQDQAWPRLQLDLNRKVISPFTENAAADFMRKSGLTLNPDLMRAVLREAAEIEQGSVGLIRPVTVNLCGLVLSRFSSGMPRNFRGGIIRGFLRESLLLPEVRDVAERIIPQLITENVTKNTRTIVELAQATQLTPTAIRACLRRLGDTDRGIVRALDEPEETWEISHDFLVPLLDATVAHRTVSRWRRARPWLPWVAATAMGVLAFVAPLTKRDPRGILSRQGWTVLEDGDHTLQLRRSDSIPLQSVPSLRSLPPPFEIVLSELRVTDISGLQNLNGLTNLSLINTKVTDISSLRSLKSLAKLDLTGSREVKDLSVLRDLRSLKELELDLSTVTDISALQNLKGLTTLSLEGTRVVDISALQNLERLRNLNLAYTPVKDISSLRNLKNLTKLDLDGTSVRDLSVLLELKNLRELNLAFEREPQPDPSVLKELKNLVITRY